VFELIIVFITTRFSASPVFYSAVPRRCINSWD